MTNDVLSRAKLLVGNSTGNAPKQLGSTPNVTYPTQGLDLYIMMDTTGSMDSYIATVRDNVDTVNRELLTDKNDVRISINGVGDHCDGPDYLQMYALSSNPAEIRGALENIVMTHGGDEPEAYECAALALAKRIPTESVGRKRAVVFIGDSYPHGMKDASCGVDYVSAFSALKTLADGFYFVGCEPQNYNLQRRLVTNNGKEYHIPLGEMVDVLPQLLIAMARKTQSPLALANYLKTLGSANANKIRGLLPP